MSLPTDPKARKQIPIYSGVIKYFPLALAEVAKVSFNGNEQHHPGTPLHWDRSKSTDELDALARHLVEYAMTDDPVVLAQVAWRALAQLEKHMERNNANAETSNRVDQEPVSKVRTFRLGGSGGYTAVIPDEPGPSVR